MEPKRAAKWIAHYRLLTSLSVLAALAVFGAGCYLGLAGTASALSAASGPLDALSAAAAAVRPLPLLAGTVGGFGVWRVGQAAAFYSTTRKVVDDRIDDHIEEKLGPAIEEELERQVEFRVEEALADREAGSVENLFAESDAERKTAASGAGAGTGTGTGHAAAANEER